MTITTSTPASTATAETSDWRLRDALSACLLAAGKDKALPILASVNVERSGRELILRGTDRYRLTIARIALDDDDTGTDWKTTVERDDVARLIAALPKRSRKAALPVTLSVDALGYLTLRTFDGVTTARGLDGDYPRVDNIVPTAESAVATPNIAFNPKHLTDACKLPGLPGGGKMLPFELHGSGRPAIIRWEHDATEYVHLLMPVRVKD